MKRASILIALLATAAGVSLAAPARAQNPYAGADLVVVGNKLTYTFLGNTYDETFGSGHLRLRGGYRFSEHFALEGHLVSANTATANDALNLSYEMTTGPIVGVYARGDLTFGQSSSVYGLIGIASVSTKYRRTSPAGPENTDKSAGGSLGFGVSAGLAANLNLTLDYMLYRSGTANYPSYFGTSRVDQQIGALGAGLSYRF